MNKYEAIPEMWTILKDNAEIIKYYCVVEGPSYIMLYQPDSDMERCCVWPINDGEYKYRISTFPYCDIGEPLNYDTLRDSIAFKTIDKLIDLAVKTAKARAGESE